MQALHRHRLRAAADLVHGHQPVEDIERGVFDAFGHDGAGQLLPAHQESERVYFQITVDVQQQDARHEIEADGADLRVAPPGVVDGPAEKLRVARADMGVPHVGPVNRH